MTRSNRRLYDPACMHTDLNAVADRVVRSKLGALFLLLGIAPESIMSLPRLHYAKLIRLSRRYTPKYTEPFVNKTIRLLGKAYRIEQTNHRYCERDEIWPPPQPEGQPISRPLETDQCLVTRCSLRMPPG
jgi:hypothetical protein